VAIKKMERAHLQRYVESEILNHSQLRHPHVVQVRQVTVLLCYAAVTAALRQLQRCGQVPGICFHL
jgi:hypothetical protein